MDAGAESEPVALASPITRHEPYWNHSVWTHYWNLQKESKKKSASENNPENKNELWRAVQHICYATPINCCQDLVDSFLDVDVCSNFLLHYYFISDTTILITTIIVLVMKTAVNLLIAKLCLIFYRVRWQFHLVRTPH